MCREGFLGSGYLGFEKIFGRVVYFSLLWFHGERKYKAGTY